MEFYLQTSTYFQYGASYKLGDGGSIFFWHDIWICNCPLKIKYALLFNICSDQDITVAGCLLNGVWHINFDRSFGEEEAGLWRDLKKDLDGVLLNGERDQVSWCLEKKGHFTVKSLYNHLVFGGVVNMKLKQLWSSRIPLKVKNFMWLTHHNRLQTADQLICRNWKGNDNCILCGVLEDANHVLFLCVLARFAWVCMKEILSWKRCPISLDDFHLCWLDIGGDINYHITLLSFAVFIWTLWEIKNKLVIEGALL